MKSLLKLLVISLLLTAFAASQVQVRSYTRKDGTVVSGYTRSKPTKSDTRVYSAPAATAAPATHGRLLSAYGNCAVYDPGFIVCGKKVIGPTDRVPTRTAGKQKRSPQAKAAFELTHPCPGNGSTVGGCHGYVVDHVIPLACGGADAPYNMQWQTVAEGKAKDKWERKVYCGK